MKVFDSSAVLAFLYAEAGAETVEREMAAGLLSAVNAAEILAILVRRGVPADDAQLALRKTRLKVVDFTPEHAALSVQFLARHASGRSLSLGDRACISTGIHAGAAVVTADRDWTHIQAKGLKVELIR